LEWSSIDELAWKLDDYSLKPLVLPHHCSVDSEDIGHQEYALIVTGNVFGWVVNYAALKTLQWVTSFYTPTVIKPFIF
jgi:cation-transporting P-type ATPase 13A2